MQIYRFGNGVAVGDSDMKDVLGGKGANLAGMSKLGVPVPPGFTIPCEFSITYAANPTTTLQVVDGVLPEGLAHIQGDLNYMPLVSVRSGARVSMPGMMDTILNVGLTTETLPEWKKRIGAKAALDSYRRLIQMYSSVALGVPMDLFENALSLARIVAKVKVDSELPESALADLVSTYKIIVSNHTGSPFPNTLHDQLKGAIEAVFKSWDNPRAKEYRKINSIPYEWGTAVTVQAMVFGNMNDASCTGVLFSRDPSTGEDYVVGEFLVNAQGEDVVAGIRTPEPLALMAEWNESAYNELMQVVAELEHHYRDMQDIEFTVQDGKLYLLQTRNGKRSAASAFKIAYDLAGIELITKKEAVGRITREQLYTVLMDRIDPAFKGKPDGVGIAAGGTVVTGTVVTTSDDAVNCKTPCILVREETDPDDIAGMNAAIGILTATGGLTSHAAVVARGMNKTCVVGTTSLTAHGEGKYQTYMLGDTLIGKGDKITIDGMTGKIWVNTDVPVIQGTVTPEIRELLSWGFDGEVLTRVDLPHNSDAYAQALQGITGPVQLETHNLLPQAFNLSANSLQESLSARVAVLAKCIPEGDFPIVLNMDHWDSLEDAEDRMQVSMMADVDAPSLGVMARGLKVAAFANWPKELLKRVILTGMTGLKVPVSMLDAGVKVVSEVKTFADLLALDFPATPSAAVMESVFGGAEAYQKAVELVKTIKPLSPPLPPVRYWYESI